MARFVLRIGARVTATIITLSTYMAAHAVEFHLGEKAAHPQIVQVPDSPAPHWAMGSIEKGDTVMKWCAHVLRTYDAYSNSATYSCWQEAARQANVPPEELHQLSIGDTFWLPLPKELADKVATVKKEEEKELKIVGQLREQTLARDRDDLLRLQDEVKKNTDTITVLKAENKALVERVSMLEQKLLAKAEEGIDEETVSSIVRPASFATFSLPELPFMRGFEVSEKWLLYGAIGLITLSLFFNVVLWMMLRARKHRPSPGSAGLRGLLKRKTEEYEVKSDLLTRENLRLREEMKEANAKAREIIAESERLKQALAEATPGHVISREFDGRSVEFELVIHRKDNEHKTNEKLYQPTGEKYTPVIAETELTAWLQKRFGNGGAEEKTNDRRVPRFHLQKPTPNLRTVR